jgi:putative ABC transport system permease protein
MEIIISTLKVYFYSLKKNVLSNLLSVIGLIVGISGFIFLIAYTAYELSYDKYHKNYKQIYRVNQDRKQKNSENEKLPVITSLIGPELEEVFPEVINNTRFFYLVSTSVGYEQNVINGLEIYATDNVSIDLLLPEIIKGDPKTALERPNTVVLSESTAKKFFGNENPIGKKIMISNVYLDYPCEVTGVMKDLPHNTHLEIDVALSMRTIQEKFKYNNNALFNMREMFYTYIQIEKNSDVKALEQKLDKFIEENPTLAQWKKDDRTYKLSLERIDHIYLRSEYQYSTKKGNNKNVIILIMLAIGILAISVTNYINFSNTKLILRVKEKNLRLLFGSKRRSFFIQFLVENFIAVFIAFIAALLIGYFYFRLYNSSQDLIFLYYNKDILLIIVYIFISVIAVFTLANYSMFISVKDVSKITQAKYVSSNKMTKFCQKFMINLQYIISIISIFCAICFYQQINFMFKTDLGMNIENVVYMNAPIIKDNAVSKMKVLKENLLKHEEIESVAYIRNMVGQEVRNYTYFPLNNDPAKNNLFKVKELGVCNGFLSTLDLKLLSGRNFEENYNFENREVIINKLACNKLGFNDPADAVGQIVDVGYGKYNIVGVVNNYYHEFLNEEIRPTALYNSMNKLPKWICIKYAPGQSRSSINIIKEEWEKLYPISLMNLLHLREYQRRLNYEEIEFSWFSIIFSLIIILLSIMGTFAVSLSESVKSRKQMAIRKLLGSNNLIIFNLLIKKYLVYLIISSLIAIPIGGYYINVWLQSFSKKISITFYQGTLAVFVVFIFIVCIMLYNLLLINRSNLAELLNDSE